MERTVIEYKKKVVYKGRIINDVTLVPVDLDIHSISIPPDKQKMTDKEIIEFNRSSAVDVVNQKYAWDLILEENAQDNEDHEDNPE